MKYYGVSRAPWWHSGPETHTLVDLETVSVVSWGFVVVVFLTCVSYYISLYISHPFRFFHISCLPITLPTRDLVMGRVFSN